MNELNPHQPGRKDQIKELIDYYQYRIDSDEAFVSLNWRMKECQRLLSFDDTPEYEKKSCQELLQRYASLKQTLAGEIESLREQLAVVEENEKELKSKTRKKKKVEG